ncbi:Os01g0130633 [Oryza sativa Japonica Group]|jgi:hypothetical protein|uniref:Os01g0130633 protein n=1 Tax=Oryza sativa subsp. japonica TaxID=39947 RepID=A0A0P0UXH4_ORYSJ|nr:Os01g0130633 [Oryza sativa Japonica Group]
MQLQPRRARAEHKLPNGTPRDAEPANQPDPKTQSGRRAVVRSGQLHCSRSARSRSAKLRTAPFVPLEALTRD